MAQAPDGRCIINCRLKCPKCGACWCEGWTDKELKSKFFIDSSVINYIDHGVLYKTVAEAKCQKCKSVFPYKRIAELVHGKG